MLAAAFFIFGCKTEPTATTTHTYTEAMYRRALENRSTAPSYVLISLREKETERPTCIPAPFLLGAIQIEKHLDYNEQGEAQTLAIALSQPGRAFSFSDPEALRNVQPRYSSGTLEEVQALLAQKSDSELRVEVGRSDGWLHQRYRSKEPFSHAAAYRDAIAHVLLERGIAVGIGDRTGALYLTD